MPVHEPQLADALQPERTASRLCAPLSMQAFGNVVGAPPALGADDNTPPDLAELGRSMTELPVNASVVHATDGYKPEAMLFVDEEFASKSRAAREGTFSAIMWKPVVR